MKQYTEDDYTAWFPGHIKPVRDGEYERRFPVSGVQRRVYWKGMWRIPDDIISSSFYQNLPWRGLKREPK